MFRLLFCRGNKFRKRFDWRLGLADNRFCGELMKTGRQLAVLPLFLLLGATSAGAWQAKSDPNSPPQAAASPSPSQGDPATRGEAYFDFVMGHYFSQEYQISSHAEDANKAIDFLKKAFTLDPSSQQIGDELAEIYYQSQRIRDAVTEAQSILAKDPDNLAARRLLALPSCECLEVERAGGGPDLLVPLVRDAIRSVDVGAARIDVDSAFLGES